MAVRWILKGGVEWYIYNIHIYNIYSIYEKKQSKSIFKLHLSHCMYLVACITLIWHNRFQVFMCLCWIHLKKRNYVEPVVSHLSDVSNCKSAIIVIYICRLCIYMYKKCIYIYIHIHIYTSNFVCRNSHFWKMYFVTIQINFDLLDTCSRRNG